jgi:hypothetical protein
MPRRGPTIAQTAIELIEQHGPMTVEELAPHVVELGRTQAKDPVAAVRQAISYERALTEGRGGRWFSIAAQLEGAVFTVSPSALERDEEIVLVRDDLALVRELLDHPSRGRRGPEQPASVHLDDFGGYFDLPSPNAGIVGFDEFDEPVYDETWDLREFIDDELAGQLLAFLDEMGIEREDDDVALQELVEDMSLEQVIHGPSGWMPRLRPREVLALEIRGGQVHARALDRRATKGVHVEAAIARIGRVAKMILGDEGLGAPAIPLDTLLLILATEDAEVFHRPLPPVSELLERGGFEVEDGLVGLPGAAWDDIRWALNPDPEGAWGFEPGDALN